jgi:NAD(P)-dependent dehydrogenase (short-subunit alcohol dehydrogenase family)
MTAGSLRRCVITGASRGLGFEFARQLAAAGEFVVATCRTPASAAGLRELLASGGLILPLKVSDQVAAAATAVADRVDALDLLINAAGIEDSARSSGPVGRLDGDALVEIYRTNAVGPALVTQAFAGLLAHSGRAVVLNVTSKQGSLAGATAAGAIGYAMSKAALNMLTRKLALELYQDRTTVVAMSPGGVQTGMGGQDAPLIPGESVRAMLACAGPLTLTDTGAVLDHDDVLAAEAREG